MKKNVISLTLCLILALALLVSTTAPAAFAEALPTEPPLPAQETAAPMETPTPAPTQTSTPEVTPAPAPTATPEPAPTPTPTPPEETPKPTVEPTGEPTAEPTAPVRFVPDAALTARVEQVSALAAVLPQEDTVSAFFAALLVARSAADIPDETAAALAAQLDAFDAALAAFGAELCPEYADELTQCTDALTLLALRTERAALSVRRAAYDVLAAEYTAAAEASRLEYDPAEVYLAAVLPGLDARLSALDGILRADVMLLPETGTLFSLTVGISAEGAFARDAGEGFAFTLTRLNDDGTPGAPVRFVIPDGYMSVTIDTLPAGSYKIALDTSWCWRYTVDMAEQDVTFTQDATAAPQTVTFRLTSKTDYWLSALTSLIIR